MFFPCSSGGDGGGRLSAYHHADMSSVSGSDIFGNFHGGDMEVSGVLGMKTEMDAAAATAVEADGGGKRKGRRR